MISPNEFKAGPFKPFGELFSFGNHGWNLGHCEGMMIVNLEINALLGLLELLDYSGVINNCGELLTVTD